MRSPKSGLGARKILFQHPARDGRPLNVTAQSSLSARTPFVLFVCAVAVLLSNTAVADDSTDRERAVFLCEWSKTHAPSDNPEPLNFCQAPDSATIGAMGSQTAEWWKYWDQKDGGAATLLHDSFEKDWRDLLQQQQSEFQRKQEEELAREVRKRSSLELCEIFHNIGSKSAYEELKRRNALSASEWNLVLEQSIQIGMSELALICSWGSAHVNRTVTRYSVHKQYVYGAGFVYVENGRVTAFQD